MQNNTILIIISEATARAAKLGHQQVLWLFGPDRELTEVGSMNIFIVFINEQGGQYLALNGLYDNIWKYRANILV